MTRVLCLAVLAAAACGPDETLSGYTGEFKRFELREMEKASVPTRITIDLTEQGHVKGQAPCNTYHAAQTAPYPWFQTGPIVSTRRACPDLPVESRYLALLASMQFAEVLGATLILSNDAGDTLVFQAP